MTEYADPEQQQAYDAEMARLSAGTEESPAQDAAPTTESTPEAEAQTPDPAQQMADLTARLEKAEKRIKDTQALATKRAQETAELRKQLQAREAEANKPKLIEQVPELVDAVRYVVNSPAETQQDADTIWQAAILAAVPEINELMKDEGFMQAAHARREELGPEQWRDPFVAIRELTNIKFEADKRKAVEAAVAKAQADHDKKQKDLLAMRVPGGSGGKTAEQQTAEKAAQAVWDMPEAEFNKMQRRALGY